MSTPISIRIGRKITDPVVRWLFPDPGSKCRWYFDKHDNYPIMHVVRFREDSGETFPVLPKALTAMCDDARSQADEAYVDYDFTIMTFGLFAFKRSEDESGVDPWVSGLEANRSNLGRYIGFIADQSLLPSPILPEDLFHPSVRDT